MSAPDAPRLDRKARLRWDPLEKRYLLLYPERGLALNEDAHAVVELCDGAHSPSRMAEILAARHGTPDAESLVPIIRAFLARLERLGLLSRGAGASS